MWLNSGGKNMLEELLHRLNSRSLEVRNRAIAEARLLPPEQLLELIGLEQQFFKRRQKRVFRAVTTVLVLFIALLVIGSLWEPLLLLGYSWITYIAMFYAMGLVPTRARHSLLQVIETAEDPRFVGTALVLLAEHGQNATVRKSVLSALSRLLPRFRADQSDLLTPAQHKALLMRLTEPYKNPELSIRILQALQQIGNESAIPVVSKITANWKPKAHQQQVVEAARHCLPYLEVRAEQAKQSQTLLRPSSAFAAGAVSSEALLRPATSTSETAPEELLRVASEQGVMEG
jgi:hypothetical protein